MGTSIALAAARRLDPIEDPVVLLERAELAAGSSGRSGAVLRQFYADRELVGMARDSLREYATFEPKTGYPVGFRRAGVLTVVGPGNPDVLARFEANVATMLEVGVEVEVLDAAGMRSRAPGIEVAAGSLGAFEPGAGFADPVLTVRSFAALARYHGATIREGQSVERLVRAGDRVARVETGAGPIEAEQIVLAAGPWTRGLLEPLGVDLPLSVIVPPQLFVETVAAPPRAVAEAEAEHAALAESGLPDVKKAGFGADPAAPLQPDGAPGPGSLPPEFAPLAHPVVLDLEHNAYARCEPTTARTRVGELDYADALPIPGPEAFEDRVDDPFVERSRGALVERFPAYADRPEAERQAAMYTVTPDAQPVLGRLPGLANVYVVAGFSGHGFKLAPSIGLGMTQLLLGEPVSAFDTAFFDPRRFDGRGDGPGTAPEGGCFGM